MSDYLDISRMPYILANFDEVKFDGQYSKKYVLADGTKAPMVQIKKRIDGAYYVIIAVSDGKRKTSHIVSAYKNEI